MEGRVEGRGEMIGATRKNRSGRTENKNLEGSASAFSFSLVEEIRKKLEVEQKSRWNSGGGGGVGGGGGGVVRGSSFDIPADSCRGNYNQVNGTTCYPTTDRKPARHSVQERSERLENNVDKFEDLNQPVRSNKQHSFQPRSILSREEDKKQTKHNPTPPDLNRSQEGNQEIDKLLKNNKTTTETVGKTRKKILKRCSKIEIETPSDRSSTNFPESQTGGQHQNIRGEGKRIITRSKPILKRSDNFEISVDKNSILRSSESVRKVLQKDLNIGGKLLHIPAYQEISFDASFKPVHR